MIDPDITVALFCAGFEACNPGVQWARGAGLWGSTMRDLWRREDLPAEYRIWVGTRDGVLSAQAARLFACWCATRTPLADGRLTGDLIKSPLRKRSIAVAIAYALGTLDNRNLSDAHAAAWVALPVPYWDMGRGGDTQGAWVTLPDPYDAAWRESYHAVNAAEGSGWRMAPASAAAYDLAAKAVDAARCAQSAHLLALMPEFPEPQDDQP